MKTRPAVSFTLLSVCAVFTMFSSKQRSLFFIETAKKALSCTPVEDPTSIEINPAAGDTIYLLLPHFSGANIFHALWGYVAVFRDAMYNGIFPYCRNLVKNLDGAKSLNLHVVLPKKNTWIAFMIGGFPTENLPINISTHLVSNFSVFKESHNTTNENCYSLGNKWNSFVGTHGSWKVNKPGQTALQMHDWAESIREKYIENVSAAVNADPLLLEEDPCKRKRPLALFVKRSCTSSPRQPIDMQTGFPAFPLLIPKVEQLGYDTKLIEVCSDIMQQFAYFSSANVVISVHGAQLTNVIFMKPCGDFYNQNTTKSSQHEESAFHPALVEISFRYAWCKRYKGMVNTTRAAMLEHWRKNCTNTTRYYHKADYFRLATGMDVRYTEVINDSLQGAADRDYANPIRGVSGVVVNSSLILQELHHLLSDNDYDFKKHPTYNGQEGVFPYVIG